MHHRSSMLIQRIIGISRTSPATWKHGWPHAAARRSQSHGLTSINTAGAYRPARNSPNLAPLWHRTADATGFESLSLCG